MTVQRNADFNSLPVEILSEILLYTHVNGDLARMRLVNRQIYGLISAKAFDFVRLTCQHFDIPSHIFWLYSDTIKQQNGESIENQLLSTLALRFELNALHSLAADAVRAGMNDTSDITFGLLLFSILSRKLRAIPSTPNHGKHILCSNPTIDGLQAVSLNQDFLSYLHSTTTLANLEDIISAVNICTSKLWSTVFLFKTPQATIKSFASLSGYTFSVEQAILTEHVTWNGPKWVVTMLERHRDTGKPAVVDTNAAFNELLDSHGPWRGNNEEGARLAANGMARYLWKLRQVKVDEEVERRTHAQLDRKMQITDLRVNAAVWRGSAGDM